MAVTFTQEELDEVRTEMERQFRQSMKSVVRRLRDKADTLDQIAERPFPTNLRDEHPDYAYAVTRVMDEVRGLAGNLDLTELLRESRDLDLLVRTAVVKG